MKTAEIRQRWLDFFEAKDHTIVPSASLISDDPSIMFTIAGMVPFIPYLDGTVPAPFPRAADCQKCIRTNDIEEVGKTARHGTFFQMLGNWSFGDYFKEGAITYAWELLTSPESAGGYGFDESKLWVTVYHDDQEARSLWKKIAGLPDERIQGMGKEDNYWSTGQPGPAGPCSEIYYDRGPAYGADGGPAVDDNRFVEIWNLVFMQYLIADVKSKTEFTIVGELPKKNIDTGMGLERVAFIKQGVENMYEIDQVRPVLDLASELSGRRYGADHGDDVRMRVVADHIRSSLMLIADGVTPSNEGRGYILRRLLRRSVRAMRLLGVEEATFPTLFTASRDAMSASYPEVASDYERISQIAYGEEETFLRTLQAGTTILDTAVETAQSEGNQTVSGQTAFLLHDTYGFPIDLTVEIAEEAGLHVDRTVFDTLMAQQKARAKSDAKSRRSHLADRSVYTEFRAHGETRFTGYTELETGTSVLGIVRAGVSVPSAAAGEQVEVILADTSLYAESGGQAPDKGEIVGDGFRLRVDDVQKPIPGLISHSVTVTEGVVAVGDAATSIVDRAYRRGATQAHSATHIIHAALRQILGPSAHQAGSFNKAGYMRLDFAWNQPLSAETKTELEEISNSAIREDFDVVTRVLPLDEAKKMGAMALFGEKYGQVVRMVDIDGAWSRELCGGTHVKHTSEIGLINLVGEGSVGSASRRVESLVGLDAFRSFAAERALVNQLSADLKTPRDQLAKRIADLSVNLKSAERKIAQLEAQAVRARVPELVSAAQRVSGVLTVLSDVGAVSSADDVRQVAIDVRDRLGEAEPVVVSLFGRVEGKPVVVTATNADARSRGFAAGAIVQAASRTLGGGGGGKPDLAQGGGSAVDQIPAALDSVMNLLSAAGV